MWVTTYEGGEGPGAIHLEMYNKTLALDMTYRCRSDSGSDTLVQSSVSAVSLQQPAGVVEQLATTMMQGFQMLAVQQTNAFKMFMGGAASVEGPALRNLTMNPPRRGTLLDPSPSSSMADHLSTIAERRPR